MPVVYDHTFIWMELSYPFVHACLGVEGGHTKVPPTQATPASSSTCFIFSLMDVHSYPSKESYIHTLIPGQCNKTEQHRKINQ